MKALLLAVLGLLAAVQAAQAETVFQRGSRIGFTPPPGMVASGTFNEYHDSDRLTSIRLQEWPDSSHARLVSALDAMAAKTDDGFRVTRREELAIGGRKALLLTVSQDSAHGGKLRKWILAISDPTLSAMAVAQSVDSAQGYGDDEMRAILDTVTFRPLPNLEEELARLPFRVGQRSGFRPLRVLESSASFTDGPADAFEIPAQPVLTISTQPRFRDLAHRPQDLREQHLRQLALGDPDLRNARIERLDVVQEDAGLRYEIIMTGNSVKSGNEVVRLFCLLLSRGEAVSILGTTRAAWRDRDLPRFQAFARGIVVRP